MPRIHILNKQVAELIAAGEVVERPSSIVKELIENSVDAGASKITVEIKSGGVKYIRITDDGCGIERSDIENAFVRHATSKVLTAEDLESIYTFGFRGEALASISAMCKVEMLTRTIDEISGTKYVINGSENGEFSDAGCPVGTTIIVRDIFYNTPARMKFLKKDIVEGNSVSNIIDRIALSNPDISIRYIKDGALKLNTPGNGDMLSTIHAVFGKEFTDGLIKADFTQGSIKVMGFISKPEAAKATRTMQTFFVNSRFVRSKTCSAALEEAYKNSIMTGKFPSCILNVIIPPQTVDVNIHPAKVEVRFSDEKAIYDAVYSACKFVLNEHNKEIFVSPETKKIPINQFTLNAFDYSDKQEKLSLNYAKTNQTGKINIENKPTHISYNEYREKYSVPQNHQNISNISTKNKQELSILSPEAVSYKISGEKSTEALSYSVKEISAENSDKLQVTEKNYDEASNYSAKEISMENLDKPQKNVYDNTQEPTQGINFTADLHGNLRLVGELFCTYIVLEGDDFMLLVDKHAAHERYIYNKLKSNADNMDKQMLLSPVAVSLSRDEYTKAVSNLEIYDKLGFVVEDFGEGSVLVREAPLILEKADISELISEIAVKLLHNNNDFTPKLLEELYHSVACRSAIKANDKSSDMDLNNLISLIKEDYDIRYCPHGRPISIKMSKREIEKMFGRLG